MRRRGVRRCLRCSFLQSRPRPGEADQRIGPPAVAEGLGRVEHLEPADRHQVLAGRFDAAQVHAEHLGNPGGFAPAAAEAAAARGSRDSGCRCPSMVAMTVGSAAPGDEAHGLAGHGHAAAVVGNGLMHRVEVGEILDTSEVCGGGGKGELGAGPGEQAEGFETAEGGPEMLSPYPTDEPMQFFGRVVWDLVRIELAASGDHLVGGKPDTEVHELDESAAVCPPHEAELLDGEKTKPPVGLFRLEFRIGSCGHVASLVWRGQRSGVRCSREGSADFGTHIPCEAHNLGLDGWRSVG